MEFVGGQFIFNTRKLFEDAGVINQNCVVEAEGKHYVFGPFDIYLHDGTSKQSICDERVKSFIYDNLNNQNSDVCFAQHNPTLNEIYFCYMSGDSDAKFPNANRCNRAAVYNYRTNCWSFYDVPNVSSGTIANVNSVATYANTSATYALTGGTYYSMEDSFDRHTLMVGETLTADGLTSDKFYGLDLSDTGQLAFELDTEATKPCFLNARVLTQTKQVPPQGMWSLPDCIRNVTPSILLTVQFSLSLHQTFQPGHPHMPHQ